MNDPRAAGESAEERLRDKRARLVIESIRDYAIFELDPQGRVASWNPGAERFKGYKAAEIIGRHFSAFYPPEDVRAGKPDRELRIAAAEGRVEDEGWRVRKDGSLFWANVVITALRDEAGALLGYAKVTRDLTQRRAIEERLRASEDRLRLLIDSVSDYAIFMLDSQGRVETWSTGAQKIKQYSAHEIIGRHFSVFYTPEDVEAGKPERELKGAADTGRYEDEGWRVRKDGSRFWANVVIGAMRSPSGELVGFSKVTRDLTERRQYEEDLRRANIAAQTSIEELETFSYSVAHDLRAPLRALDGFSEILSRRYATLLDEQGLGYLKRIRDGSVLMGRLIDDLLKLSRVTRGTLARELVDLSALAGSIVAELRRVEPQRRGEAVVPSGLVLTGDASILRVLLENLLQNAWKYTSRKPAARIEFGSERRDGETVYFVRDNGAGFDMRFVGNLFKPFSRLHRHGEFEGTGIGLATVRRIVARYGGRIWAEGAVGEGAVFYFTLPGAHK